MENKGVLSRYSDRTSASERRLSERAQVGLKVRIHTFKPVANAPAAGPALVHDISLGGACLSTRHSLRAGQVVDVSIPTEGMPSELGLPKELAGRAIVRRIETDTRRTHRVSLVFLPALANSMEFAFMMAYLLGGMPQPAFAH